MVKCPFLSTHDENVECFENCSFYNLEDANGECPFKAVTGRVNKKVKRLHNKYYFDEEEIYDFDEEYKKVEYM